MTRATNNKPGWNYGSAEGVEITVQFPGLPARQIGPGDDIVISSEKLADYIAARERVSYQQGYDDCQREHPGAITRQKHERGGKDA